MGIFTKSDSNTLGECNCSIGVDNRLVISYQYANKIVALKSSLPIKSRTLSFVTITRNSSKLSIYVNGKLDAELSISNVADMSINPLILGNAANSIQLNGYIENFVLSTTTIDNLSNYFEIYGRLPTSNIFIFNQGRLISSTYNNYTSNPSGLYMIEESKLIVSMLTQYLQGFVYKKSNESIMFYIKLSTNDIGTGSNLDFECYQKVTGINLGESNVFIQQVVAYPAHNNVIVKDPVPAEGQLISNNGIQLSFQNGSVLDYDIITGSYTYRVLSDLEALNIMNEFSRLICYLVSDRYIFYVSYTGISPNPDFNNSCVVKHMIYNIGSINSNINYIGVQNSTAYDFNYNNNFNTNTFERTIPAAAVQQHQVVELKSLIEDRELDSSPKIPTIFVPESRLFVYDSNSLNVTNLLDKFKEVYISSIPKMEISYPIDLILDHTNDMIESLINKSIKLNRQIIFNFYKILTPGMYSLSIISNSMVVVKINGKEHVINSINTNHLLFHHTTKYLELEISFYYEKISQILKFMLVEP
jgi:hypothetical protein